ncbi:16S rRNA (adenine(1518)-N(6)/adenine(1519)-N(6))-dimethyltransferase [marine bacterium AO1-C]|nr:16S rRNA (adenine(1518)-N(6)/adenine(1519)-N(6))-dimethyltransferase [marine bacterium AO1-C]
MVKPKKHLGQHFLTDLSIAERIVDQLCLHRGYTHLVEIGAGTGVLTDFLLKSEKFTTHIIEIDTESVQYLQKHYPELAPRITEGDFLNTDLGALFDQQPIGIIGNFPYNISSQIFFKVLDHRQQVQEVVCMLQKEVAERIAAGPGSKTYGILSVLLQAYYDIEYKFTVPPDVFDPPPKVHSGVITLVRNEVEKLDCDEKLFKRIVKQGFNNRRKTLRNALKSIQLPEALKPLELLNKRAEQLSVADFVTLTQAWEQTLEP